MPKTSRPPLPFMTHGAAVQPTRRHLPFIPVRRTSYSLSGPFGFVVPFFYSEQFIASALTFIWKGRPWEPSGSHSHKHCNSTPFMERIAKQGHCFDVVPTALIHDSLTKIQNSINEFINGLTCAIIFQMWSWKLIKLELLPSQVLREHQHCISAFVDHSIVWQSI